MYQLTEEQIAAIMPRCRRPGDWVRPLNMAMVKYKIAESPDFVTAFLAQIAVESMELNRLDENLSYSPQRLVAVWPRRFPTVEAAIPYARNPQALGTHVYGGRMGNKPYPSDDGYRYRGRGLIQLTGRSNYALAAAQTGLDLLEHPDLLLEARYAALTAAWYWDYKELNWLAQRNPGDDDAEDFRQITRKINGGLHGIKERETYYARAQEVLGLTCPIEES